MLDHHDDGDLTTISFSDSPSPPEQREDLRRVKVLRVARLQTPRGEELCLVRNISSSGLMAHIYSELNVEEPVTAEFKSGQPVAGRVQWRRDGLAGIVFDEPVSAEELLAARDERQPRAPRVDIDVKARIRVGVRYHVVALCNISQGGGRISPSEVLEVGQKLILMVSGLSPIAGSVRWLDKEHAGIAFDTPIPFETLARWVPTMNALARQRQDGA